MKRLSAIILAGSMAFAAGMAAADEAEDEKLLELAAIEWAGMNCGKTVPNDVFGKASAAAGEVGWEAMAPYRAKIQQLLSAAETREIKCQSIMDAFDPLN